MRNSGLEVWLYDDANREMIRDEIDRRVMTKGPTGLPVPHPRVRFQTMDEPLAQIFATHQASLSTAKRQPIVAPQNLEECVAAFGRFLTVAFG
ncbi:MAG: hypothetical protein ACREMW_12875 [Gemmatimonadales bacterium]